MSLSIQEGTVLAESKELPSEGRLYFVTSRDSQYYLLSDGRTQRYKFRSKELKSPQDIIVFLPNYSRLLAMKPPEMSEGEFQTLYGESEAQYFQNLLSMIQGVERQWRTSIITEDGQEIKKNTEKKTPKRLFLKFEPQKKGETFFLPVQAEPQMGSFPFD